jgi:hypothetical protein
MEPTERSQLGKQGGGGVFETEKLGGWGIEYFSWEEATICKEFLENWRLG